MTPRTALDIGRSYLDEATENLTFDQFGWAFEETCRGVAWILNALAPRPADLALPPKGQLLVQGTLASLSTALQDAPRTARVAARLEALGRRLAAATDREIAFDRAADQIERLTFEAWELHDDASKRLGVVDERLGDRLLIADASPGKVGSRVIHRRTALKLLAASSVVGLHACTKPSTSPPPASATAPEPEPTTDDAAKLRVVTPLGGMHWETSDPFLFCAHHVDEYPRGNEELGPAASLEGRHLGRDFEGRDNWRMYHGEQVPGFPRHPHRGFETVTVVRTGMLDHSDSLGATARYGGGDVQWLTAGHGIQHAEMFPLLRAEAANPLELFQIWLNLPASDKMVDPYFTMLWSEKIPRITKPDAAGRVVELTIAAGSFEGQGPPPPPPNSWASRPESDLAIWSIRMEAGAQFVLPAVRPGTLRSLYFHGAAGARVLGADVAGRHRAQIEGASEVALEARSEETEFLLLQGRPIGEPVAKRGPFVMNTQDEIRQAYADYQRTQFGGWPWHRSDPVHLRDRGRFARHIDGRFEEPG